MKNGKSVVLVFSQISPSILMKISRQPQPVGSLKLIQKFTSHSWYLMERTMRR